MEDGMPDGRESEETTEENMDYTLQRSTIPRWEPGEKKR